MRFCPAPRLDTIVTLSVSGSSAVASSETLNVAPPAVLRRFDTDDHFLQRLFAHELFGVVPDRSGELFRKLERRSRRDADFSADGKARLGSGWRAARHDPLASVHQAWRRSRQSQTTTFGLTGLLNFISHRGGPLFRTPDGSQFQVFPAIPLVSRKTDQVFFGIYKLAALAIHHFRQEKEEATRRHGG